jgi:hypothetical protein
VVDRLATVLEILASDLLVQPTNRERRTGLARGER